MIDQCEFNIIHRRIESFRHLMIVNKSLYLVKDVRMKRLIILMILMGIYESGFSQTATFLTYQPSWTNVSPTIMLVKNNDLRHTNLLYTDYKLHGYQVISLHQPNTPYDWLFYVDENGKTQYRSMSHTGLLNMTGNYVHRYDSFNPYGARAFGETIVSGVLNTIFSRSIRTISFR